MGARDLVYIRAVSRAGNDALHNGAATNAETIAAPAG
jgi:hypothetical protein